MLHVSIISYPTYINELVELFLKLSMKTVQLHLIIGMTLDKDSKNLTDFCGVFQSRFQRSILGKAINVCNDLIKSNFFQNRKTQHLTFIMLAEPVYVSGKR